MFYQHGGKVRKLSLILMSTLCVGALMSTASAENLGVGKKELEKMKSSFAGPEPVPYPKDNPYSEAKAELGKSLFFDPRLSTSGTQSCATCHNPSFYWQDGMPKGVGHEHKTLARRTTSTQNLAWDALFFWDGRGDSLESQATEAIALPKVMNMTMEKAEEVLNGIKGYAPLFKNAFPEDDGKINRINLGKAIATYERTLISKETPFDKWVKGDEAAISETAKLGFVLFNKKANCVACHSGWTFSDSSFHDIGLASTDIGRGKFEKTLQHAFKTTGLRNIVERAPYMHDGSLKSLAEVVEHYNSGFTKRESLSDKIKPLKLTDKEKGALVAFLGTLSSKDDPVTLPILPR
jgi:cytochrome c peroxidase